MGVNTNSVILIGQNYETKGCNKLDFEKQEELYGLGLLFRYWKNENYKNKFCYVYDGISGEYCYYGKILLSSKEHGFNADTLEMDIDYIEKIKQEVEENIRINKIDEFFNENICVKLHVFSHWS